MKPRVYPPKPCKKCGTVFQPGGGRSDQCDGCLSPRARRMRRTRARRAAQAEAQAQAPCEPT